MPRRNSLELSSFDDNSSYRRRPNIRGESFDPEEDPNFSPPFYEKTPEERESISRNLREHFLFKNLPPEVLDTVIGAMFKVEVAAGEVVIREGDDGDYFYCVQRGLFEVDKNENGERKLLGYYEGEGCFGELALMHQVGRATSVTAARDGVLWALDRRTFQRTLLGQAHRRRSLYEKMLSTFPILRGLTDTELADVADSLTEIFFHDGEEVFQEGDPGTGMYWVVEGEVLLKKGEAVLKRLGKGEYFGELALLKKDGRAATAQAIGELKLVFLDANAFERLLGPCLHIMRQRLPGYQAEMDRLNESISHNEANNS